MIPRSRTRPNRQLNKAEVKEIVAKETAVAKGLRYVSASEPGIHRLRSGKGFRYVDAVGSKVTDASTLDRIRKLAIPPAYQHVWICAHERGHLQATGIDARGRKQYRYHAKWRSTRDNYKFTRMCEFGARLPQLRQRLKHDLALRGLTREKVLALVVTLLQQTLVRVGNAEYARQNRSFGLTTLRVRHVKFLSKGRAKLEFRGKSGKDQVVELSDSRVARILRRCHDLPGQYLFQYLDANEQHQPIDSGMVNDYLLETMGTAKDGTGFTAKDFRTWGGTLHAIKLLTAMPPPADTKAAVSRGVVSVCKLVAEQLGNTPAICRKSYINPWVFTAWSRGVKPRSGKISHSLLGEEKYALQLLNLQLRHADRNFK